MVSTEKWKSAMVAEAIQAMMDGKTCYCMWAGVWTTVKLNKWFELNVNHIQRGEWYIDPNS